MKGDLLAKWNIYLVPITLQYKEDRILYFGRKLQFKQIV